MVIDKTENILFYTSMVPALRAGMEAVKAIQKLEPGKYKFDGGFFNVQTGGTKPMDEGTFEAHRRYIDVQIVAEGCEELAWADVSDLKTVIPYDKDKDAERLEGATGNHIRVDKGMFYIAFPHDGHKPVSHTDEPHSFTKIVMKIPVMN